MSKAQETADAQRAEAKNMLCRAAGLPEDIMSGAIDRAVDCIIGAAVLEAVMIISQEARELIEHPKMSASSWSHALNDRDAAIAQVSTLRTARVQNPAENEHVAGDVSKNEAELNMSAQQEVQEPVAHVLVPYYTVEEVFDASLTPQPAPAPLNLNCKSTQKRLATLWGFVPAGAQEPCAAYAALPPNELRTNYLDLLQEVLDAKDVMLAAGCQQDSFGAMFAEYSAPRGQAPAQPCMAKQSPHPEYGKGFSDGWDRCEARQAAELDEVKTVCAQAYQVVGILLSEAGRFDSPEAEKILDNLGEQRLRHTDVLPWESKAAPQQEAQEPAAWMTQEGDRVVTEKTMNAARRGGGAMLTSLHSYSVALVRAAAPQPSPVAQGDAEDAAQRTNHAD